MKLTPASSAVPTMRLDLLRAELADDLPEALAAEGHRAEAELRDVETGLAEECGSAPDYGTAAARGRLNPDE